MTHILSVRNQRIAYIDVLKAFSIFIVVLGHVCQNYCKNIEVAVYHHGILPYHMPFFAVLSGLFFSANVDFKTFMSKKFTQLALPYLIWCFIVAIVIRGVNEMHLYFSEGFDIHFKSWAECFFMYIIDWGWWFIRTLFLSFIYAYVAIRLCQRHVTMGVLSSTLLLYVLSLSGIIPNKVLKDFVFLYPFFCVGILMRTYKTWVFELAMFILPVAALCFFGCMLFWQGYDDSFYSMNTSMYETEGHADVVGIKVLWKTLYRFVVGTSASVALILLARKMEPRMPSFPMIQNVGRNTLGIYILQGFIIQIIPPSYNTLFENEIVSLMECLLISITIAIVCHLIVNITSKNKYLALLLWGRKTF